MIGALIVFAGTPGRSAGAVPTRSVTTGAEPGLKTIDKALCGVLGTATVAGAARTFVQRGAGKGVFGSLLAETILATATWACPKYLPRATKSILAMARGFRRPATRANPLPRQSKLGAYRSTLQEQSAATIASQVVVNGRRIDAGYVGSALRGICADLAVRRSPIDTIGRFFPGAKLSLVGAMTGVVRLAIARCPLNAAQANFLSSLMTNYLINNQYPRDLEAPAAWVVRTEGTRYTNGINRVTAYFTGSDRGTGIRSFQVWIEIGRSWRQITSATTALTSTIDVRQGSVFRFAVRALDGAGNYSYWAYGPYYTA
jgi:hypothetical protein